MIDTQSAKIFKIINVLFWCVWLLVPFFIMESFDWKKPSSIFAGTDGDCIAETVDTFGDASRTAIIIYHSLKVTFSLAFLALMHRLVYACVKDRIFIQQTMSTMGLTAALLISWPLVKLAALNAVRYVLYRSEDIATFNFTFEFELLPISVGLFIVVLRLVLVHALRLHEEAKLTI